MYEQEIRGHELLFADSVDRPELSAFPVFAAIAGGPQNVGEIHCSSLHGAAYKAFYGSSAAEIISRTGLSPDNLGSPVGPIHAGLESEYIRAIAFVHSQPVVAAKLMRVSLESMMSHGSRRVLEYVKSNAPCTGPDIARGLRMDPGTVKKHYIPPLVKEHVIRSTGDGYVIC